MNGDREHRAQPHRAVRVTGLVIGLVVATVFVGSSRIPRGTGTLGADVILASSPSGEIAVTPVGPFITDAGLTPATPPRVGRLTVLNQTGSVLRVQLRGVPSTTDMDSLLMVEVDDSAGQLFRGSVGAFRDWTARALTLRPGEQKDLDVRTWVADDAGHNWSGRVAQVVVEFHSTVEGAS